ncbi:MAG: NADH:ubiquinone reductase (Na(+)-transporting) subunit D [Opitutaceae bacterium]|nr:NADH:ubiquinone reductase (Na(+)-transporting) subunit D [Opitutaceae bacterium]
MAKLKETVLDPLSDNNPITVQVLGICSALAVTIKVETSFVMSLALTSVLICSNLIISLLRNVMPSKIRMIVEMTVIASLVILADNILKAYMYDVSRQLSVFVGLIITNCIVMGRAEAFALQNPPRLSLVDGFGNGLGYSAILIVVASLREVIGFGTWYNYQVLPLAYEGNGLVILAPGAFIIIGLIIWIQRSVIHKVEED